jgi:hypothetical protein
VFRRRVGAWAALVVGTMGLAAAACGLDVSGLEHVCPQAGGDATLGDAPTDAVVDAVMARDATGPETSTADGGDAGGDADGAAGTDAQPEAAVDACGSVEICDDGVDNDCDGLVDCADPQCQGQGWTCVPAMPAGWVRVAYDPAARPGCPAGWGSSSPLVEGPDAGAAVCVCSCGPPLVNPCDDGTATMSLGGSSCACSGAQNVPLVSDGGCDPIGSPVGQPCGAWGSGLVKPIGLGSSPVPVACADDPQRPAITYSAQGESCTPQGSAGAGCPSGGGCLPGPAPAVACVEATGVQPCPSGFTQQHVAYAPSNVVDQRQCGSCGCTATPTGCSAASVTLYGDPGCAQNPVVLKADGTCDTLQGDPSDAGWFRYSATLTTTMCSGAATTGLDGGLLLRAPATICCP